VQFIESVPLRRLFEFAAESYTRTSTYQLNPHLSLIYRLWWSESNRSFVGDSRSQWARIYSMRSRSSKPSSRS
jgi:hypothetical protein